MPATGSESSSNGLLSQLRLRRRKPAAKPKSNPKHLPPYAVVLHNDRVNRFEWVVGVLIKVLRVTSKRAVWLTLKTHVGGRSIVWTGSFEVAELKAEQLIAAGPDPTKIASGAKPLKVSLEPMPQ
ncbi:MAG TPA: ATP-dependent Clp protease adaptor ClpS [Tepidisphaeraceae bacterium]|jgi:ATP-dependent Clp protease adaptor protein ClpS